MVWLVIIVVFNILALEYRREPSVAFQTQAGAHYFVLSSFGFEYFPLRTNFFSIGSEHSLNDFFLIAFPTYMFAPIADMTGNFDNINVVRIRQVRTKEKDCEYSDKYNLQNFKCYYPTYSDSTKETEPIASTSAQWANYQSASETDVAFTYVGEFSDYDGSGYVLDVPYDINMYDFIDQYSEMLNQGWMSPATRAIFLTYTRFLPSVNSWVDIFVAVEISVSGSYLARTVSADFMNMDKNDVSSSLNRRIAIIRILLSFFFVILFVLRVLIKTDEKRNYSYILSFYGLLDFLTFLSMLVGAAVDLSVKTDPDSAFNDEVFTDFSHAVSTYKLGIGFNCFALVLVFFHVLRFLRAYQPIDFALTILEAVSCT